MMQASPQAKTMDESFFEEYTSQEAVHKYTKATAGKGISYLLDHDYHTVYMYALANLSSEPNGLGLRILEFGCGGGMNLLHLVRTISASGRKVHRAIGTDFSPVLIDAARRETSAYLPQELRPAVEFHVARNESLLRDLTAATSTSSNSLSGTFDLVIGVNTMRYSHRNGSALTCAQDIKKLLALGGVCVNIDMNAGFPAFRSALKERIRRARDSEECHLPSLDEYAAPFRDSGFELLRKENFCWIPHSADTTLLAVMRALTPILNRLAKNRAMRSLIVAKRPASG
jgi:SAM-dependent methyltransferase